MKIYEQNGIKYEVYFDVGDETVDGWKIIKVDIFKCDDGEYQVYTTLEKDKEKKQIYQKSKRILQHPKEDKGINFFHPM
jgi:hypothetical protein